MGLAIAEPRRQNGSAIPWPSPPGAGDPLQGPPTTSFDCTLRCFGMFRGSNDLRILRNKYRCVRIEDSSARFKNRVDPTSVLREKPRIPKDTHTKRRNDDAWPSPEPPNWGARLWGSAIANPRRQD